MSNSIAATTSGAASVYQRRLSKVRVKGKDADGDNDGSTSSASDKSQDAAGGQNDLASTFAAILKNGGGVADLKAAIQQKQQAFESSDKFKSLPADVQAKIKSGQGPGGASSKDQDKFLQGIVDQYKKTGTVQLPHRDPSHGAAQIKQLFAKLQEQGLSTQGAVLAKFNATTATATAGTDKDGDGDNDQAKAA